MPDPSWTVDDHLRGKPHEVIKLYRKFVELVEACGPFQYSVSKTAITFKGSRRGFAGAKPRKTGLSGYLDLQRVVEDPRITAASPYTQRLYVHHFRVDRLEELDQEFGSWVEEAYDVGRGTHLSGPEAGRD